MRKIDSHPTSRIHLAFLYLSHRLEAPNTICLTSRIRGTIEITKNTFGITTYSIVASQFLEITYTPSTNSRLNGVTGDAKVPEMARQVTQAAIKIKGFFIRLIGSQYHEAKNSSTYIFPERARRLSVKSLCEASWKNRPNRFRENPPATQARFSFC